MTIPAAEERLRHEIAERTRAERELESFFDLSLDLLCIAGIDGKFKRLNRAFETLLGYPRAEMLDRPFLDFVHPDDRERSFAELVNVRRGATTFHFENRYLCKDGSVKWLEWTASPATPEGLIYGTARDVTDAKESADALRRSEARTRSIIDNLLGGLVTTDARGNIESVNPAAERMFRYGAADLVGCNVGILFDDTFEDERMRRDALGRAVRWRALRSNGESFVCEISVCEFDAGDNVRHFAVSMLDISEREEIEQMKKDFMSAVSHELRTPLTSIHGSLGLLASGAMGELNDEAAQVLSVAERNSVRLVTFVNNILEFGGRLDRRPAESRHALARTGAKVLVVDDEEDVRYVARLSLGRVGGMSVIEASSGEEGIERAKSDQPDFILLDMMMPGMDGASTFHALRACEDTASIPIVFITAKSMTAEVQRLTELGARGVITKPFNPLTLANELTAILES